MESSSPASTPRSPAEPSVPPRPEGLKGFLRGPRLVDHRGFGFVVVIFVLVLLVFGIAFYAFMTSLQPPSVVPIGFAPAYMLEQNGTFNVSSDGNASWPAAGFEVNLSINNVWAFAVPLAASGQNATVLIGPTAQKDAYHIVWLDRDHNGAVSVGDAFRITGNGVGLPALSYVHFTLTWRAGGWTADEYFTTSSTII